jgi:hypothetical protein
MLFLASAITLAVFTIIEFSNPRQAWVRASKDDRGNDPAVVVTKWGEIRTPEQERAGALIEEPKVLMEGRNALELREVRATRKRYRAFGRGGYGLGQRRSHVEAGAAGARTWRRA